MESLESLLGTTATLTVDRVDDAGAWLSKGGVAILLPKNEAPPALAAGEAIAVFVYLDSEDRPVATTRTPAIAMGEVDFLMVTDLTAFGAFVSWGLRKDLLVPLREQIRTMRVGERHAVGLYLDSTCRLAGTTRVAELLRGGRAFERDEWVGGVAFREEPGIGLFVILEKRALALLPFTEPHRLFPGDAARFRVTHVLPDKKVEVTLRAFKHEEMDRDAENLLALLRKSTSLRLGDHSSPEDISNTLAISKKAFKRAAGRLLKEGRVEIDEQGFLRPRKA